MIAITCAECGSEASFYPSSIRKGRRFCSRKCSSVAARKTSQQKFERFIAEASAEDCWEWTGARVPWGYGAINIRKDGKTVRINAHRVAYELYVGPIPKGMFVCHTCDNPPCCNPAHLFLGTAADNSADMVAKSRQSNERKRSPGERNPAALLTENDVIAIRQSKATALAMAKQYGVARTTVNAVRLRNTWKHVP
jgi:ribosomal protein L24E